MPEFSFISSSDWNWLVKRVDACLQSPLTQDLSIHNGYDIIWYADAGSTEKARIDGATGNISTVGYEDMTQMSTPANPGSGIRRIFVDSGTGKLSVRTSGGSTVSLEESGGGSQTLNQTLAIGNTATGYSILMENGYDIIWYSDAGSTEKARIDGATGNITTSGTVDGADISAHAHTGSDGTPQIAYSNLTSRSHGSGDHTGNIIPGANQSLGAYYMDVSQIAAPSNPSSGTRRIYMDSSTGKLSVRTSSGTSVSLEEQAGATPSWNSVLGAGNADTGYNVLVENGYDIIWYSDAGTTIKAQIYGDTGRGSFGRAIGSVGIPTVEIYGTASSTAMPALQEVVSTDNYPTIQLFSYSHDNIGLAFDCYYDGSWRSSDAGSNFMIYKYQDFLRIHAKTGITAGNAIASFDPICDFLPASVIHYFETKHYNGADLVVYSDAGSTEKARIDGATGNITTVGTVDTVDVSTLDCIQGHRAHVSEYYADNGATTNSAYYGVFVNMPAADADCRAIFHLIIPRDWSGTTGYLKIWYTLATAGSGYSVKWDVQSIAIGEVSGTVGANILSASTAYDFPSVDTAQKQALLTIPLSGIAAGDKLSAYCSSDASNTPILYIYDVWLSDDSGSGE